MGSFPFSLSKSDTLNILKHLAYAAGAAALAYLAENVLPSLSINNPTILILMPFLTAGVTALEKYLKDTRPVEAKEILPTAEYKALPPEEKKKAKAAYKAGKLTK